MPVSMDISKSGLLDRSVRYKKVKKNEDWRTLAVGLRNEMTGVKGTVMGWKGSVGI